MSKAIGKQMLLSNTMSDYFEKNIVIKYYNRYIA